MALILPKNVAEAYAEADRVKLYYARTDLDRRLPVQDEHGEPVEHPESVARWAELHRRIDGQRFSLDRFKPLEALYHDRSDHIVVIKPSQRGVSEWAVNFACFALDRGAEVWTKGQKDGLNVAYLFPTEKALGDFSKERLNGLKRETPYLSALFSGSGEFDAVTFKQVGESYLYLRGAYSGSALLSFACDVLILDEFDRMDRASIALARRRMNASEIRREIDLSTPTVPGTGIHGMYLRSDRRHYLQRCPLCGERVELSFLRDVYANGEPRDQGWSTWSEPMLQAATFTVHCPACRGEWQDDWRYSLPGEWIADNPEVTTLRGYWIPELAFPMAHLRAMALSSVSADASEVTEFYRSDLGKPYVPGGGQVTEDMVRAMAADPPSGEHRRVTMGIDVGARMHYRISAEELETKRVDVLAMGSVADWSDLDHLMKVYSVKRCIVDALPELHSARDFAERHKGKVWTAFYPTRQALKGILYRQAKDEPVIEINRTMAMDAVYSVLAGDVERWPAHVANDPEVIAHLTSPSRTTAQDARGQEIVEWVHSAPDHLYHACVYDITARRSWPKSDPAGGPGVVYSGKVSGGWYGNRGRGSKRDSGLGGFR